MDFHGKQFELRLHESSNASTATAEHHNRDPRITELFALNDTGDLENDKEGLIEKAKQIFTGAVLKANEEVIEYLLHKLNLVPVYDNEDESALTFSIRKQNVNLTAILYLHMRKYFVEDISESLQCFKNDEEHVKALVREYVKDDVKFPKETATDAIIELLLNPNLFKEEPFNNIYLYAARYASIATIHFFFDKIRFLVDKKFFDYDMKYSADSNGDDVLMIMLRYRPNVTTKQLKDFCTDYGITPDNYNATNKNSALYYSIENEVFDVTLFLLQQIPNTRNYNVIQRDGFVFAMKELQRKIKKIPLRSSKEKKSWGCALTLANRTYPDDFLRGRETKANAGLQILRPKTWIAPERQILRHIATQLFYRWRKRKGIQITEVQVMKVQEELLSPSLIIAINPISCEIIEQIKADFSSIDRIKDVLQLDYSADIRWAWNRSNRYSRKLKSRMSKYPWLVELLNQDPCFIEKIQDFQYECGKLYLSCINGQNKEHRHAEEELCDIADHLRNKQGWRESKRFSIYGRTRPCMSCCGRMKASNIHNYNKNASFLLSKGIENQSDQAARETLQLLMTSVSHVTVEWGTGVRDYDTASDSE